MSFVPFLTSAQVNMHCTFPLFKRTTKPWCKLICTAAVSPPHSGNIWGGKDLHPRTGDGLIVWVNWRISLVFTRLQTRPEQRELFCLCFNGFVWFSPHRKGTDLTLKSMFAHCESFTSMVPLNFIHYFLLIHSEVLVDTYPILWVKS